MSRRPPSPSFRSGSRVWSRSPLRAWRTRTDSSSSGRRPRASVRQSAASTARRALTTRSSPATHRTSRAAAAVARSARAMARASSTERTAWSRPRPLSQIGYHRRCATCPISSASKGHRSSTRSSRSRSLSGPDSRRARLPEQARAMPGPGWSAVAATHRACSHCSVAAVMCARDRAPAPRPRGRGTPAIRSLSARMVEVSDMLRARLRLVRRCGRGPPRPPASSRPCRHRSCRCRPGRRWCR